MNTRNTQQLAAEINRMATAIEAVDKTAGRFKVFQSLFNFVFHQLDATIKAVKRRDDLPDQTHHHKNVERLYSELEECWGDLGKALQAEEDLLYLN